MRLVQSWPKNASPDELAALMTALVTYLESSDGHAAETSSMGSRWARAGRLEAFGQLPSRSNVQRGWRL